MSVSVDHNTVPSLASAYAEYQAAAPPYEAELARRQARELGKTAGAVRPPVLSVGMITHAYEKPAEVMATLDECAASAQGLANIGPTEVIMWVNAESDVPGQIPERVQRQMAASRYGHILQALKRRDFDPNVLTVRPVFDIITDSTNPALDARRHMGSAVLRFAVERGLSDEFGMVWVDADTPYILPSTFPALHQALTHGQEPKLHHAHLTYDTTINPEALTNADRIALTYAEAYNFIEDMLGAERARRYQPECGMAFRLATYAGIGGLRRLRTRNGPEQPDSVMGESRILETRFGNKYGWIDGQPNVLYVPDTEICTSLRNITYAVRQRAAQEGVYDPTHLVTLQEDDHYRTYMQQMAGQSLGDPELLAQREPNDLPDAPTLHRLANQLLRMSGIRDKQAAAQLGERLVALNQ